MTTFEWLQAIAVIGTLTFVAIQSWLMRRAVAEQRNQLRVQSCLQVWQAHVQTCHLSIATGSDEVARELNKMSPYQSLDLVDARRAHFADATMDLYECITLMTELGILEADIARVWKESVPYEMRNPNLREHWRRFHDRANTAFPPHGIYLQSFADMVDKTVQQHEPQAVQLAQDRRVAAQAKEVRDDNAGA